MSVEEIEMGVDEEAAEAATLGVDDGVESVEEAATLGVDDEEESTTGRGVMVNEEGPTVAGIMADDEEEGDCEGVVSVDEMEMGVEEEAAGGADNRACCCASNAFVVSSPALSDAEEEEDEEESASDGLKRNHNTTKLNADTTKVAMFIPRCSFKSIVSFASFDNWFNMSKRRPPITISATVEAMSGRRC